MTASRAKAKASSVSIHQGQLASKTTLPRVILDKWDRIASRETLTKLWLCLYAKRQLASNRERENTQDSRSLKRQHRRATENIPTSAEGQMGRCAHPIPFIYSRRRTREPGHGQGSGNLYSAEKREDGEDVQLLCV